MSGGKGARRRRDRLRGQLGAIKRDLKAANVIIEVRDARLPEMTSVTHLLGGHKFKRHGILLTKADLADSRITADWVNAFRKRGLVASAVDLTRPRRCAGKLSSFVARLTKDLPGVLSVARIAVVGLPNVGKSTVINRLVGRRRAPTGNRPGVTKGKQWIRLSDNALLLDTPGVIQLFSGIEQRLGDDFYKLVLCNVVPAGQYDSLAVVETFLSDLSDSCEEWPFPSYRAALFGRLWDGAPILRVLETLAGSLGLLSSGGRPDVYSAAERILTDFRQGKPGVLSLERPGVKGSGDTPSTGPGTDRHLRPERPDEEGSDEP